MDTPAVLVEDRIGPFAGCLDTSTICAYGAATKDPAGRVQSGETVPAVAVVTQIWAAQEAGRNAVVSHHVQTTASGGVHGEHDILLHRPISPGEPLRTWVRGYGARPAGANTLVTLHYSTYDERDALVAEQWWTTVYINVTSEPVGPAVPDHRFPDGARGNEVGRYAVAIDPDMARRYAEVSGDWSEHHFTISAARQTGFDRPFLHGLCTMALCAQGVVATVAAGDHERVRRIAVRFATPAFLGEELKVRIFEAEPNVYAFEADSAGKLVITHGRTELRP